MKIAQSHTEMQENGTIFHDSDEKSGYMWYWQNWRKQGLSHSFHGVETVTSF